MGCRWSYKLSPSCLEKKTLTPIVTKIRVFNVHVWSYERILPSKVDLFFLCFLCVLMKIPAYLLASQYGSSSPPSPQETITNMTWSSAVYCALCPPPKVMLWISTFSKRAYTHSNQLTCFTETGSGAGAVEIFTLNISTPSMPVGRDVCVGISTSRSIHIYSVIHGSNSNHTIHYLNLCWQETVYLKYQILCEEDWENPPINLSSSHWFSGFYWWK